MQHSSPKRLIQSAVCLVTTALCFSQAVHAGLVLSAVGAAAIDEFDDFRGGGFSLDPASTQLDSSTYRATGFSDGDGLFGGTHTTGDFARGIPAGGLDLVNNGGVYGFEVSAGNWGVGVQPTATDFNPGTFTIRISNQTGGSIDALQISADGYFFNDQNRSTNWTFALSTDDATYQDFFSISSQEAASASPAWAAIPIGGLVPLATPVANNSELYVRITGVDLAGTGDRDLFALGRFSVTAVPEPSCVGLMSLVAVLPLTRRRKSAS